MKCPRCQQENTPQAKFCLECAESLGAAAARNGELCGSRIQYTGAGWPAALSSTPRRFTSRTSRMQRPNSPSAGRSLSASVTGRRWPCLSSVRARRSAPLPSSPAGTVLFGRGTRTAPDLRRSGGHRHRERAVVHRAPGEQPRADHGAGHADRHQRHPARHQPLADGCPAGVRHHRAECRATLWCHARRVQSRPHLRPGRRRYRCRWRN
jgi:hypothetical protein